jgi:4-hydroxybenzoate polyprenyltransferase
MDLWSFFAVLAIIAITVFYQKTTVWGGLSLGIVTGLVICMVYVVQGHRFAWDVILKAAIIGALAGAMAELVGIFLKQRRTK